MRDSRVLSSVRTLLHSGVRTTIAVILGYQIVLDGGSTKKVGLWLMWAPSYRTIASEVNSSLRPFGQGMDISRRAYRIRMHFLFVST
jgi:hypothetical protein